MQPDVRARKAFVLGALVGAGVLAAVGAVSAGGNRPVRSASSQTAVTQIARMGQRAEVPPTALPELAAIDERLNRLVNLAENLDLAALLPTEINAIDELQRQFGDKYLQAGLGIPYNPNDPIYNNLEGMDFSLHAAVGDLIQADHLDDQARKSSGAEHTRREQGQAGRQPLFR